jgi:formylglycine-generating enzyme required for sulfatase activity
MGEDVQPAIRLTNAFAIDAYEVTVQRFAAFIASANAGVPVTTVRIPGAMLMLTGFPAPAPPAAGAGPACNWGVHGRDLHPINCIDWYSALAFCVWDGGRLPTEAEWEWVARSRHVDALPSPRRYPWGDEAPGGSSDGGCDRAQWNDCPGDDGAATREVGAFAATGGVFDLAGNVREWTLDQYAPYTDPTCWNGATRDNPMCGPTTIAFSAAAATQVPHALRGGSFSIVMVPFMDTAARTNNQAGTPGHATESGIGFRCVRDP